MHAAFPTTIPTLTTERLVMRPFALSDALHYDGVRRQWLRKGDTFEDVGYYSMLRSDWEAIWSK